MRRGQEGRQDRSGERRRTRSGARRRGGEGRWERRRGSKEAKQAEEGKKRKRGRETRREEIRRGERRGEARRGEARRGGEGRGGETCCRSSCFSLRKESALARSASYFFSSASRLPAEAELGAAEQEHDRPSPLLLQLGMHAFDLLIHFLGSKMSSGKMHSSSTLTGLVSPLLFASSSFFLASSSYPPISLSSEQLQAETADLSPEVTQQGLMNLAIGNELRNDQVRNVDRGSRECRREGRRKKGARRKRGGREREDEEGAKTLLLLLHTCSASNTCLLRRSAAI
eukprot:754778-Hanusia_phi.AAC.2